MMLIIKFFGCFRQFLIRYINVYIYNQALSRRLINLNLPSKLFESGTAKPANIFDSKDSYLTFGESLISLHETSNL